MPQKSAKNHKLYRVAYYATSFEYIKKKKEIPILAEQ